MLFGNINERTVIAVVIIPDLGLLHQVLMLDEPARSSTISWLSASSISAPSIRSPFLISHKVPRQFQLQPVDQRVIVYLAEQDDIGPDAVVHHFPVLSLSPSPVKEAIQRLAVRNSPVLSHIDFFTSLRIDRRRRTSFRFPVRLYG